MLKDLIKVANKLDSLGFQREADVIDTFIKKVLDEKGVDYTYNWNVNWSSESEGYDLNKEAEVINSALTKSASLDSQLDEVGSLWGVFMSDYGQHELRYLLTTKEAAEKCIDYTRQKYTINYSIEEMPVYRLKKEIDLTKSAMHLGEGYLTCDECGTRFSEFKAGSKTTRGHHVCPQCSGDISLEEAEKRRSGAFESFRSRRHRD